MKTLLVINGGALGDFILSLPAMIGLRKYLQHHIFIGVTKFIYYDIIKDTNIFDIFFDINSRVFIPLFTGDKLPPELRNISEAVLWLTNADNIREMLEREGAHPVITISTVPESTVHAARFYLQKLSKHYPLIIPENLNEMFPVSAIGKKYILIHPGSGSPDKNWSIQLFKKVASLLSQITSYPIRFIVGPTEKEGGLPDLLSDHELIKPPGIDQLITLLKDGALYIGNDSGVSHLAAVLGVFSIVLYKTTDPAVWGTIGRKTRNIFETDERKIFNRIKEVLKADKFIE
jgi:heptosyltransferase-3